MEQDTSHNLYLWYGSLFGNFILFSKILLRLATFIAKAALWNLALAISSLALAISS